jgi:Raf kinase inhibitor-like YbhB/YbcL family protein
MHMCAWRFLPVLLAGLLAGCGGGSGSSTSTVVAGRAESNSPAAVSTRAAAASVHAVAPGSASSSSSSAAPHGSNSAVHGASTTSSAPHEHSSVSAVHGASTPSSASSSSGEVYPTPGAFAISSPAFERNGAISVRYTCAGAGVSPPLQWEKVPAGAAELVLFVIDDTANSFSDHNGGIHWVVGGIDPSSTGVAAGQTPAGAILGTNTAGKAGYSPICPASGKSDTIEFTLYALKQKIPLSPGFQPTVAEREYGAGNLLLGQTATTYGIASRP